ncbi:MAG: hypothetical protein AB7I33_04755 [Gemmatimonadales bacterium]
MRLKLRPAGRLVFGLLLLTSPGMVRTAAAQVPDSLRSGSPALVKYGKWAMLAASIGMGVIAARAHDQAETAFDYIRGACFSDKDLCTTGPDGRYTNPTIEDRYQLSLHYDRRARAWLWGAEGAFAGAALLFIWEFTRPAGPPRNIPFEPEVSTTPAGATHVGFKVGF